jgi:hypothetical protein
MEELGRSQIGGTMSIYSHAMPTQLAQAASAMEEALWGTIGYSPGSKDEQGRSLRYERPACWGGAEGTRTPDPHTARSGHRLDETPWPCLVCPLGYDVVRLCMEPWLLRWLLRRAARTGPHRPSGKERRSVNPTSILRLVFLILLDHVQKSAGCRGR